MTAVGCPMFSLAGKTALITGAASGIGAATAEVFASLGARTTCGWYAGDAHDVQQTVRRIVDGGGEAIAVEADVGTAQGCNALIDATVEQWGQLDIVLANAGIARIGEFASVTDDEWDRRLQVNLGGVVRCFRGALAHMVPNGTGRLLATTSTAGYLQGWPLHVDYTTAKAGIVGLVRGLSVEVASHGVTVNAVAPGIIKTPQSADPVNSIGPTGLAAIPARIPAARVGHPREIATAFAFLASDEAAYVTGQVIVVDGGASLSDGT
jgi:3-oxoacyl-[acyl-carrier protein] reductase